MIAPTLNQISQGQHGQFNAVDYRAKDPQNNWRKEIYAPEDGQITAYVNEGNAGVGKQIQMQGNAGRHGLAHTESMVVKVGDYVKKGQLIGYMGYTGYTVPAGVQGSHLHWTIRRSDGAYVYPPSLVNEDINNFIGGDVKPTEKEIKEYFLKYLEQDPPKSQVEYYLARDKRDLLNDILVTLLPNKDEVTKAFNNLLGTKPNASQYEYYPNRGKDFLYRDIAVTKQTPKQLSKGIYEVK